MIVLTIVYTASSLWVLAQPITEHAAGRPDP
jgi:hypothetical protein